MASKTIVVIWPLQVNFQNFMLCSERFSKSEGRSSEQA